MSIQLFSVSSLHFGGEWRRPGLDWAFLLALQLYFFIFVIGVFWDFFFCVCWLRELLLPLASSFPVLVINLCARKVPVRLSSFHSFFFFCRARRGFSPFNFFFFSSLYVMRLYTWTVYPLTVHIPLSMSWLAYTCTCSFLAFLSSSLSLLPASASLVDSLLGFSVLFFFPLWCLARIFGCIFSPL